MKITAVTAYVVRPELGALELRDDWQWTFVVIDTDFTIQTTSMIKAK